MRRPFMLALVLLLGVITACGQDKPQTQTILFVCEHGSAKSVIAAAHFNRLAKQRGLPHCAIARGINPDAEISLQLRLNLAKDRLDVAIWKAQGASEKDVRGEARVVTFGCGLPFPENRRRKAGGLAGRTVDRRILRTGTYDYREQDRSTNKNTDIQSPKRENGFPRKK